MPACLSHADVGNSHEAPIHAPAPEAASESSAGAQANRDADARRNSDAKKVFSMDELVSIQNGSRYIGQQADVKTQATANSAARAIHSSMKKLAQETRQQNLERFQGFQRMINNTTVAMGSFYMSLKNKIYGLMVSDRGEVTSWLGQMLRVKDADGRELETFRNPIVRAHARIEPVKRSFAARFTSRREQLVNSLKPVANRIGMSLEDIAILLGHYSTARHAPERNEFLLRRWRQELSALLARGEDNLKMGEKQYAQELAHRIDNLERFKNSDLGDYDEATDGPLFHSGYTNKQAADKMAEILRETGITREEADAFSDRLTEEFNFILQERARNGTLDPNIEFPDFAHYVPMLSRHIEGFNNYTGAGNDASPYNPGAYYAAEGRQSAPDSAFVSLAVYGERAATEIATRDFGFMLHLIKKHLDRVQSAKGANFLHHLREYDYNKLMRTSFRGGQIGDAMHTMYNRGGFVASVPVTNTKTGAVSMKKMFYCFDPGDYVINGMAFSGDKLNKGISSYFKAAEPGPLVGALARTTSFMGQLTTRYTPLFSPVSGMRDFGERMFNMSTRTYYTADGKAFSGADILGDFISNAGQAGTLLLKGMRGQLEAGSREAGWWQEFNDQGLAQRFAMRAHVRDKDAGEILGQRQRSLAGSINEANMTWQERVIHRAKLNTPVMNRLMNRLGSGRDSFLRVVDNWNDYYQNLAAFDHYITLRKKGVDAASAADDVLEMMNLSQRGSIAPWLQAIAPFVVPTVQSGTAMLRSLGFGANNAKDILKTGWKGYTALAAAWASYSLLMPLIKESLGTDEDGNSIFDAMSFNEATRSMPIGLGDSDGNYLRIPIGFGFPQLGAMMAVGIDRVGQGRMSMSDLAFELMYAAIKNVAPGNWPEYDFKDHPSEFMMSLLTPQPFRPLAEINQNLNYFGNDIHVANIDPTEPRSEQGRTSTKRFYHNMARGFREAFGIDMEPEVYKHFERGYALGPLRGLMALVTQSDKIYRGSDRPALLDEIHPVLAALGLTSWLGKVPNPEQSMYYEAKRHYDNLVSELDVDIDVPENIRNDRAAAERYKRNILSQYLPPDEVDDFISIWRSMSDIQNLSKDFNKQYRNRWLEMEDSLELREAFDKLDEDGQRVYSQVVQSLNYYNR